MSDAANQHRGAAVRRVLGEDGRATVDERRAAFANMSVPEPARALVDKVARHAYTVTDEDIAAAKAGGLTEDQIFELCVCAAMGQATRQLDAAFAVLDAYQDD